MEKQIINVRMFGDFSITYKNHTITSQEIKSPKLILLFSCLIGNQDRQMNNKTIANYVWKYEKIENHANALKNLVYRLRTLLRKQLGIQDLLITANGRYQLNPSYVLEVDALMFQELLDKKDFCEKALFFKRALSLYQGAYLKDLEDDPRIGKQAKKFQKKILKIYCDYMLYLEKRENYKQMIEVAKQGIALDRGYVDFYALWIKGLYLNGEYEKARAAYTTATDALYMYSDVNPNVVLQEIYEKIQVETHPVDATLLEVMDMFGESMNNQPLYVEYGTFKKLAEHQKHLDDVNGANSYIALITVESHKNDRKVKRYLEKTMDDMKNTLLRLLEYSDVFSRFSNNQYVVLKNITTYEKAREDIKNMTRRIHRNLTAKDIAFHISLREVAYD